MPFQFCTSHGLVEITGRRARTLSELLGHLRQAPVSAVYQHAHGRCALHGCVPLQFPNDLAEWCSRVLQEQAVAERLAAVPALEFTSLETLRRAFLDAIEASLDQAGAGTRECPPGDEFQFLGVKRFAWPVGVTAGDLQEFTNHLPHCSDSSLFFHFAEARLRLERPSNDFSEWLAGLGEVQLADDIENLSPRGLAMSQLREEVLALCRGRLEAC